MTTTDHESGRFSSDLTASERRILKLRAAGLNRTDIARILHRSPQTISNSLTLAKEKLGARSLTEAVVLALSLAAAADDVLRLT